MGRNPLALLIVAGAILLQSPASAATPEFQITPRAGFGRLKVDGFVGFNPERVDLRTLGIGAGFGYLTPIGLVVELGADSYSDFNVFQTFESFTLTQEFASVGYQFDLGHRWRLVPRVGAAHWKLHTREGRLFNPGPEEARNVHGNDYFWEVGVARQISRIVTLGVNLKQGQYEFGRTRSAAFTVTLGLGQ